jgi:RNA polymerase sigma-70 factor (ECF subfamily)
VSAAAEALDRVFRNESGAVLATLIRVLGDFQLAEDALQDALTAALETWPAQGLPDAPAAWLTTTARRKALDRFRHARIVEAKSSALALAMSLEQEGAGRADERDWSPEPDDPLRLIFTCCHPALSPEAQVTLTLRTLGGLSIGEIARAFLASDAAIAQRLARAKQKIRRAGIPYEIPDRDSLEPRLDAVLSVLYLIFNEGYWATGGQKLVRGDLVGDALRLATNLAALLPDEPEPLGLLALVILHDSRREARTGAEGELVLLEDQDRSLWKRDEIEKGLRLVEVALRMKRPGPYQIQAAIAAVHAEATTAPATDWPQIKMLYDELLRYEPTPVVELNRAVAVSFAANPELGLQLLVRIESNGALENYAPFHLARADMLRRLDRRDEAHDAFKRALPLADNEQVRRFIESQLRSQ